jgi:competence protein ComEA
MNQLKKLVVTLFVMLGLVSVLVSGAYAAGTAGTSGTAEEKSPAPGSGKLININTAGVEELVKLPRVGEKIAQRIIEYREKNGKFKKIEDLMKVKGIGEKTFKKFEKMLTV